MYTCGMEFVIVFFVAHWYLSLLTQTIFLHRYSAHRQFTMSPFTEKVFFVVTWIFQGPSYLSAYAYGIMHRKHHAFADTPDDPHSPRYDANVFAMMRRTGIVFQDILDGKTDSEPRFVDGVPRWDAFDRFASSWPTRIAFGAVYVAMYVIAGAPWWTFLTLLPIQFAMGPVHGAIINWCAHVFGYRNYETSDTSRNFLPVDVLMLGESYHNNHHAHPRDPNFGKKFHELDPSYLVIRTLHAMRIITIIPYAVQEKGR